MKTVPFLCRALVVCGIVLFVGQTPAAAQSTGSANLIIVPSVQPSPAPTHSTAVVTITVSNADPTDPLDTTLGDATNVMVTFVVPKGLKIDLSPSPCTLTRGGGQRSVSCPLGTIVFNGTPVSFQFNISSTQAGPVGFLFDATDDQFQDITTDDSNVPLIVTFQ